MKKKSILVGTVALGMAGFNLTACNNVGEGKDVRDKEKNDLSTTIDHDNEAKCGKMKDDTGAKKAIEAKCGEGKDSTSMKSDEMLCGEGKCGEGQCGGSEK